MFEKITRWECKKWREAARDQPCTMILPCCNHNKATTVLAHANGAGMGLKQSDYNAADMCSSCHDEYDGRTHVTGLKKSELEAKFDYARYVTIVNRLRRGIVK